MSSQKATVLIVDDEPTVTELLSEDLAEQGYDCSSTYSGDDALARLAMGNIDVVLLDLYLPGIYGIDVLREIAATYPRTAVIIVTAVGDTQTAVEAMKMGASDYITKPFKLDRVNASIEKALQKAGIPRNKPAPGGGNTGTEEDWGPCLDNIARGVQIRYEIVSGHTVKLTEGTISIARRMGIPEEQIDRWAKARQKQTTARINGLHRLLNKLDQNPMVQTVLGMTEQHQYDPNKKSLPN